MTRGVSLDKRIFKSLDLDLTGNIVCYAVFAVFHSDADAAAFGCVFHRIGNEVLDRIGYCSFLCFDSGIAVDAEGYVPLFKL